MKKILIVAFIFTAIQATAQKVTVKFGDLNKFKTFTWRDNVHVFKCDRDYYTLCGNDLERLNEKYNMAQSENLFPPNAKPLTYISLSDSVNRGYFISLNPNDFNVDDSSTISTFTCGNFKTKIESKTSAICVHNNFKALWADSNSAIVKLYPSTYFKTSFAQKVNEKMDKSENVGFHLEILNHNLQFVQKSASFTIPYQSNKIFLVDISPDDKGNALLHFCKYWIGGINTPPADKQVFFYYDIEHDKLTELTLPQLEFKTNGLFIEDKVLNDANGNIYYVTFTYTGSNRRVLIYPVQNNMFQKPVIIKEEDYVKNNDNKKAVPNLLALNNTKDGRLVVVVCDNISGVREPYFSEQGNIFIYITKPDFTIDKTLDLHCGNASYTFQSQLVFQQDNQLYILYNTNAPPKSKEIISLATIDLESGDIKQTSLFTTPPDDLKYGIMPNSLSKISSDEYMFFTLADNVKQFRIINLKIK